jgi:hypothetical protein
VDLCDGQIFVYAREDTREVRAADSVVRTAERRRSISTLEHSLPNAIGGAPGMSIIDHPPSHLLTFPDSLFPHLSIPLCFTFSSESRFA